MNTETKGLTSSSRRFITKQPGKTIWILYAVISIIVRIPFWLLIFVPAALRQQPQWTYRQAITNKVVKAGTYFYFSMRVAPTLSLDPGKEKERFVILEPAPAKLYLGVLEDNIITPATIGGTWYPVPYRKGAAQERVILHFHGGAYALGSGRDEDTAYTAKLLIQYVGDKVFAPQYRLCSVPSGRFPAALQDAVTSYKYLLDLGIPSSSIVLSGDSAGGHLIVSLLRYISEYEPPLPAPSAALLWSAYLDLVPHYGSVESHHSYTTDFLSHPLMDWSREGFVPEFMHTTDPYISHPRHPFATKTPLWVGVSGGEVLEDENAEFVMNMKHVNENKVELYAEPHACHDILGFGNVTGFEAEAESMAGVARSFLDSIEN
ncbi:hypothetical protein MMC18_000445 [Xylographa bjoerkii]|nr:hypothetical protein [Xylographa bjoerkii]